MGAQRPLDIPSIREDFPALSVPANGRPLVYLDNATTTQRPRQILDTLVRFYTRFNANIQRSPHALGQAASELYQQAHAAAARFIGARSWREIVFLRNTTEAINAVAVSLLRGASGSLAIRAGDEIVITVMEHHSNLVPWQALCAEHGVHVKVAVIAADGSLDMDSLCALLGPRTRLVCCTHVSNVLGTVNAISRIAEIAHSAGALLLVDGAQSVPHMPVNVQKLGCDFLAFSGHKMLAPFGIGVLYGREELLQQMSPFLYGGGMIESVTLERCSWNELPWKFEAGTPNVAAGIALGGAIDRRSGERLVGAIDYLEAIGMEAVQAHEATILARLYSGLSSMRRVLLYGPQASGCRAAVISFSVDGGDPLVIAMLLDSRGFAVRAGGHCAYPLASALGVEGTVRVSPYIYNSEEETDRFLNAVDDIVSGDLV
ncbi:MAG: hypothetical protein A2177_10690 [Spirochaetes bacterium RBG_13_68_11]|nr:MAG: hypothetical protein A2177_10690 [Spirochaetes bacterium RBG_13_68_11]